MPRQRRPLPGGGSVLQISVGAGTNLLFGISVQHLNEPDHVGIVGAELVVGSVAADDEVFGDIQLRWYSVK